LILASDNAWNVLPFSILPLHCIQDYFDIFCRPAPSLIWLDFIIR